MAPTPPGPPATSPTTERTNFNDLLALAQNYNKVLPALSASQVSQLDSAGGASFAAAFAQAEAQVAVPEPGTLSLVGYRRDWFAEPQAA